MLLHSRDTHHLRALKTRTKLGTREKPTEMEKIEHTTVATNGINLHVASIGSGPAILFLHGFPELWYSWRHQMLSLSALGYRAIAPDLRGYGGSTAPADSSAYSTVEIVRDLVGLLDAMDLERVFLVGHDWGAVVAWHFCLLRPQRVTAMVNTSVAAMFRDPLHKPLPSLRALYSDDFYFCRFQEPGKVEDELSRVRNPANIIKGFFQLFDRPDPPILPPNVGFDELFNKPISKPSWLTDDDVDYYAKTFARFGFTGGLNYYRATDRTWEAMAEYKDLRVEVPVRFVAGDRDLAYNFVGEKEYIHDGGLKRDVPLLEEPVTVLKGVAHFLNQEKPEEVTALIHQFFHNFK